MRVATAQLPEPEKSQDRVIVTQSSVIVLDGATPFAPVDVSTEQYVDKLGAEISSNLDQQPEAPVSDAVAQAIRTTARELRLSAGNSPSSTVCVLRARRDVVDLYCLGDSAIYYGTSDQVNTMVDRRLARLGIPEHQAYRDRIAAGSGYDATHRELLAELQHKQRMQRNRDGGYWIAEAAPEAANHGYTSSLPEELVTWAILATDGAYSPMLHLGLSDWPTVARESEVDLKLILETCARWERDDDPDGRKLPRAKVSDDKTLVAVEIGPC